MDSYKIYPGHEIFPIKTETACMLKWSWSTVNLERGITSSCHRTQYYKIDPNNFNNFHNLPEKVKAREDMLDGQWPGHGCEYCKKVEDHGGISDRLMTLQRQHGADKVPPELFANPTATSVTPTILEVYFNNTCNLSCVYCGPALSSKWNDEIRKFGQIEIADIKIKSHSPDNINYTEMVENLWKYLAEDNRHSVIRHFHLLGGETLLQKELDQSIEFWNDHPNPSLTFNLISNLMLPHHQFVKKMSKFEKLVEANAIFMLELTASLDCLGPEQEYARTGIDLDLWIKNFEYMLDKPWVKLAVHSCMTVLTIKTMPELMTKINEWNKLRPADMPIDHSFDFAIGQQQKSLGLHPITFGPGVFDQDFEKIIDAMPTDTENQLSSKKQMRGLANFVKNTPKNPEAIAVLIEFLTELDRRRNTNWQTVFPWIAHCK